MIMHLFGQNMLQERKLMKLVAALIINLQLVNWNSSGKELCFITHTRMNF